MGSLFSSSQTQNSGSNSQTTAGAPWQQGNLHALSSDAQGIYNSQQGNTTYNGQIYNPINGMESSAANSMYGNGTALSSSLGGLLSSGALGLNGMSGYMSGANNFANGDFNQGTTDAGMLTANNVGNTTNALNTGINGALSMSSNPSTQTASDMAAGDAYANDPAIQNEIKANTQQIATTLNDSTLPSLNSQAIAGGNLNSSRAGAASAQATALANQNAQSYAANVENNAFNTGSSLGQTAQETALNGNLGAANAANSGTYAGLMGMNGVNSNAATNNGLMMSGTDMLGNGVSMGDGLLSSYGTNAGTAGNLQYGGGGILQQDGQGQDNATLEQYLMNMQQPWTTLDNLQGVQGQPYGSSGQSSGSTTNTSNPSVMQDMSSVMSMLGMVGGFL